MRKIILPILVILAFISLIIVTRRHTQQEFEQAQRHTQQEFEQGVEAMYNVLTDSEMKELHNLSEKAVNMLPDDERKILLDLQEKFAYGGYKALSDKEISTMQQLNNKAMNLLPKAELERLQYLMYKVNEQLKTK